MISARVDLVSGWGERMARELERQARDAIRPACEEGARVASQASAPRRRTGLMAQMEVLPTVATPRGYAGGFRSKAYYAGFQSRGTRGLRRGRLSAATLRRRASASGRARSGGGAISPLGFLERGAAAARRALLARLNRIA